MSRQFAYLWVLYGSQFRQFLDSFEWKKPLEFQRKITSFVLSFFAPFLPFL